MINILEILKKIPNLEDMVFYSPIYGDVKVELLNEECSYPINLFTPKEHLSNEDYLNGLTKEGYFENYSYGEREPMLYPSRQNRDWSTFKIPRKDLSEGETVLVSWNSEEWKLGKYAGNSSCYSVSHYKTKIYWNYIIPVDKFNFNDWSFKEEDNYGTAHKE